MLKLLPKLILVSLVLSGMQTLAQLPTVTVRFANPRYDYTDSTYRVDAEFHCDTPNQKLYTMSVRFFYDDNILEFLSFDEFMTGYGVYYPIPPYEATYPPEDGPERFGIDGPPEYVSGGMILYTTTSTYISTTGWTKYFAIVFHVDDSIANHSSNFCPSILWDLQQDPANGGFYDGSSGVVILVNNYSDQATENVEEFNWDYDTIEGLPFGYPEEDYCISTKFGPKTSIDSVMASPGQYVTFPITVCDFDEIDSLSLTLDYDPDVLEYCCCVPDSAIAGSFLATKSYAGRIHMEAGGFSSSLCDESVLIGATFKYLGGTCALTWYDDDTSSCVYTDVNSDNPLIDYPMSAFYIGGQITSGEYTWTGGSSTGWDDASNWESNMIPGRFTDVIINSSPLPSHWPTYSGDFTLGQQCMNLTLNGNAQFTVTGNFTINPGSTLDVTGNGMLNVGQDWKNSGNFNPGLGSINFYGTNDGNINDGQGLNNNITGYEFSTFPQGMSAISGGSAGPSGDNAHSDVEIGFTFNFLGMDYTQVRINTNGWISFNLSGDDSQSYNNLLLFTKSGPISVLAPWWDDLLADGSSYISYLTVGTSPDRVFTTEWNNILAYSSDATARLDFQVKLHESTNIIEFCYGDVIAGTHNADEGASIGIKDTIGGAGNFKEAEAGTCHLMIGCLTSDSLWPSTNYRFSPSPGNVMDTFHAITVSKESGELRVDHDIIITGIQ